MYASSYDLLVLHKNVYRVVVKEILPNNHLDYNGVRIMYSMKFLVDANLLTTTNEFNGSI